MKRKLLVIIGTAILFSMSFSLQVSAWTYGDVELTADCLNNTISGEIWIHDPDGGMNTFTFGYTLFFNGEEAASGVEEVEFNLPPVWGAYPFTISNAYDIEICENGVVTGIIEWLGENGHIYDTASLGEISLTCFCPGGEGCTPGYWKNHLGDWQGYEIGDDFDTVFGVDLFDPDITLLEAVKAKGGHENRLARHGTAALLSAAHSGVSYPLSEDEVILTVQAGDTDALETENELGCPR